MSGVTFAGIFGTGFVFGYLLYYAVRHTKEFNVDLLSSAIGAVGGATVIGLLSKVNEWIGPYGLGLATGFFFYLCLSLLLICTGKFDEVAKNNVLLVSKTLLGTPRQE